MAKIRVTTKNEVLQLLTQHRNEISKFGIRKVHLFGSFLRENNHSRSDIDLLVYYDQRPESFDKICEVEDYFKQLFGRKVDVVDRARLSRHMRRFVLATIKDPSYKVSRLAYDVCFFNLLFDEVKKIRHMLKPEIINRFDTDAQKGYVLFYNCSRAAHWASKISPEFKKEHTNIPWMAIQVSKRNTFNLTERDNEKHYKNALRIKAIPIGDFKAIIKMYRNVK